MIVAANFKCNKTRVEFIEYAKVLDSFLKNYPTNKLDVYVAPSFTSFINNEFSFDIVSQNIYPAMNGAYTGEIGLIQLQEFGINSVILGHCERRAMGESDEILSNKFQFCKANNLKIIYCIGEDIQTYEKCNTLEFIKFQLECIDVNYENLIIAYEPIYSIGKVAAKIEDIEKVCGFLKTLTTRPILYGGSVNASNFENIKKMCDGVLIGSASLDVDKFIDILKMV